MKANWILALVGAAIVVGVVVAVGVLWAYGYYLGPVSRNATDWGSFGSVMSGAFTLLSSFATIGTLLFLYLQQLKSEERQIAQDAENLAKQLKHDAVVEKQLAALTFEQYLKHRKVFVENIEEVQKLFQTDLFFSEPEKLYRLVFPENTPEYCSYSLNLGGPSVKQTLLVKLLELSNHVENYLCVHPAHTRHHDLLGPLIEIKSLLTLEYDSPIQEGDIIQAGVNSGINLYEIPSFVSDIEKTLNAILFFSGNEEHAFNKRFTSIMMGYVRSGIKDQLPDKELYEIHSQIEGVDLLHELRDISSRFYNNEQFRDLVLFLDLKLLGKKGVISLAETLVRTMIISRIEACINVQNAEQQVSEKLKDILSQLRYKWS